MATFTGHWPTLRDDGITPLDTGIAAARWDERLVILDATPLSAAAAYIFVGPANVRLPVLPRQTRFPKLP